MLDTNCNQVSLLNLLQWFDNVLNLTRLPVVIKNALDT